MQVRWDCEEDILPEESGRQGWSAHILDREDTETEQVLSWNKDAQDRAIQGGAMRLQEKNKANHG